MYFVQSNIQHSPPASWGKAPRAPPGPTGALPLDPWGLTSVPMPPLLSLCNKFLATPLSAVIMQREK